MCCCISPLIHYTLTDIRNAVIQKSVLAKTTGACEGKGLKTRFCWWQKIRKLAYANSIRHMNATKVHLDACAWNIFDIFYPPIRTIVDQKHFPWTRDHSKHDKKYRKQELFPLEMKKSHKFYPLSLVQTFARNELFKLIYFVLEKVWARRKSYAIKTIQFVVYVSKFHFFACFCNLAYKIHFSAW